MLKLLKLLSYIPGFILAYIFMVIWDITNNYKPDWKYNVYIVHRAFIEWYNEDSWL